MSDSALAGTDALSTDQLEEFAAEFSLPTDTAEVEAEAPDPLEAAKATLDGLTKRLVEAGSDGRAGQLACWNGEWTKIFKDCCDNARDTRFWRPVHTLLGVYESGMADVLEPGDRAELSDEGSADGTDASDSESEAESESEADSDG